MGEVMMSACFDLGHFALWIIGCIWAIRSSRMAVSISPSFLLVASL